MHMQINTSLHKRFCIKQIKRVEFWKETRVLLVNVIVQIIRQTTLQPEIFFSIVAATTFGSETTNLCNHKQT